MGAVGAVREVRVVCLAARSSGPKATPRLWSLWALCSQPEASPQVPSARLTSHRTPSGWRGTSWSPYCTWLTSGTSKHPQKTNISSCTRERLQRARRFRFGETHPTFSPRAEHQLRREHVTRVTSPNPAEVLSSSKSILFRDEEKGHRGVKGLSCGRTAGEQCGGGVSLQRPHLATFTGHRLRVVGANPAMGVTEGFLEEGLTSSPRAGWYNSNIS